MNHRRPLRRRLQAIPLYRRVRASIRTLRTGETGFGQDVPNARALLLGLVTPTTMLVVNGSMFSIALPTIRHSFGAQADLVAWLVAGFSLSYVVLMPVYGRLADGIGKKRLFMAGIVVFLVGTGINLLAFDLRLLLLGRVIQGLGASGIVPLAIAMISELFPINQRGKALGTWNSVGPVTGIVAPLLGGLLIEGFGWRISFAAVMIVGMVALLVVRKHLPDLEAEVQPGFLLSFDWVGVVLLCAAVISLLFYLSSRPITGVAPLRDWRLLGLTCLLGLGFVSWEQRRQEPFIALTILRQRPFTQASLCAGARMFVMSGIGFLLPLYLADVHALSAAGIGTVLVIHAAALLVTVRMGGQLSDVWGSRRPVVLGLTAQSGIMLYFAVLPPGVPLLLIYLGLAAHGLAAGLALAGLHRAAMEGVPQAQMGVTAGLYSMIRFGGTVLGTTLSGVILQQGLEQGMLPTDAYRVVYSVMTGVGVVGIIIALTLDEDRMIVEEKPMRPIQIVLVGPMPAAGKALLQAHLDVANQITVIPEPASAGSYLDSFETADVIVGGPITKAVAERARRLKLFHVFRGGIGGLGLEWLPPGTPVANTYHHGTGIAEFVLMAMLMLPRRVCHFDGQLRRGCWDGAGKRWGEPPDQEALPGKVAMIIGLGHIGKEIAIRARAFGTRLIAVSRSAEPPSDLVDATVSYSTWRDHLPECDYVIASCRLAPNTQGLFGREEFGRMKASAYFINVAQAAVADEQALYEALRDDKIAGAALDVWYQHPQQADERCLPSRFPIHELSNVLLSPDRASWTRQMLEGRMRDVAENVNRLASGRPLINLVDREQS